MTDGLVAATILTGGAFAAIAGLGLLRLPDVYVRMHASTKAGTLAVGLILIGVALHFQTMEIVARAAVVALFVLLTAPIAAHLIGRAAHRGGTPLWEESVIDETRAADPEDGGRDPEPASAPRRDQGRTPPCNGSRAFS